MKAVGALVCLCLLGTACGCGADDPLRVQVDAGPVLFDDTGAVVVESAEPDHDVTITATATDGSGVRWIASATYRADGRGRVDTASDAPRSGSYEGAHATGLLFSLAADDAAAYETEQGTLTVTYTASADGHADGKAEQERTLLPSGLTRTDTDLASDGIVGTLFQPTEPATGADTVLVLGGSEGGNGASTVTAAALAARGVPALALAYFGAPGLPDTLSDVPVEYFGTALRWLADQPGIDPGRLALLGGSRGSEAALLTAQHYPDLVDKVVLTSPTSYVNRAFPGAGSAWTWQGEPLAFGIFDQVEPSDPAADIPVDRIDAPMFIVCGDDDHLWPSCPSAQRIVSNSPGLSRTVLAEPDAGHLVSAPVPGYPLASGVVSRPGRAGDVGGTVEADSLARLDAWPQLLAFLGA